MTVTAAAPEPPPPRQSPGSCGRADGPLDDHPVVRVVQARGRSAGRRDDLAPGRHTIGREPAASVRTDDPTVSARHVRIDIDRDGRVTAADLGSTNGTRLDGVWVGADPVLVAPSAVLTVGATAWRVEAIEPPAPSRLCPTADGQFELHRPPRTAPPHAADPIEVPDPPDDPPQVELGVVTLVAPLAVGVVLGVVFSPVLALLSLASPLMLLAGWGENRRRRRRALRSGSARYRERLDGFSRALDAARRRHVDLLGDRHPDAGELRRRAERHHPRLWERRPGDPDFLSLSVGRGERRWSPHLEHSRPACDEVGVLLARPLVDIPVEADLGPGAVLGITGDTETARALVRGLLCQLVVHHGPADVAVVVASDDPTAWAWLDAAPHLAPEVAGTPTGSPRGPHHVAVVEGTRRALRPGDPVRRLLDEGASSAIVVHPTTDGLPARCDPVVVARPPGSADGSTGWLAGQPVRLDGADPTAAAATVAALGVLHDPETPVAPSDADPVPLHDLLELGPDRHAWAEKVAQRWRPPVDGPTPVGVDGEGRVDVDLVRDGPHGLIAGTTGAGKSELLRTLVLSSACTSPPEEISFVLVDYKGGSAFDACADLPHVVGLVTDLDERLAARALRALRAELVRRERQLRAVGAPDLEAYRRASPDHPLPRLVVVIDEFATLAADVPDFLPALVGVAQRGRSLGLHLLLATQRPAGVVTEEMRANLSLRIALRVVEGADSSEVIGTSDAARLPIDKPGAALLRRGTAEPTPFQTSRTVTLDAIVEAVRLAHERRGGPTPACPWLPPMPRRLALDDLEPEDPADTDPCSDRDLAVPLARLDDPDRRRQVSWRWTAASGHLLICGATGSGTTSALRTVALAAVAARSADDLHLYVLHAGRAELRQLEDLPHTGGVVSVDDDERLDRLLTRLETAAAHPECDRRERDPHQLLLIDGLDAVADTLAAAGRFTLLDRLVARLRADPDLGLHIAATTRRGSAIPGGFVDATDQRLILRLNDPLDYAGFGLPPGRAGELPPGRGFDARSGNEIQLAAVPDIEAAIASLIARSTGTGPPAVETLPERVGRSALAGCAWRSEGALYLPLGLGGPENAVSGLRLERGDHAVVTGGRGTGRSGALCTLAAGAVAARADTIVIGVAGRSSMMPGPLTARAAPHHLPALATWLPRCHRPWLLLIDDAEAIDDDGSLEDLIAGSDGRGHVIATVRVDWWRRSFGHWTRGLLASETGVLLGASAARDAPWELPGPAPGREPRVPGRGVLLDRGEMSRVQLAAP